MAASCAPAGNEGEADGLEPHLTGPPPLAPADSDHDPMGGEAAGRSTIRRDGDVPGEAVLALSARLAVGYGNVLPDPGQGRLRDEQGLLDIVIVVEAREPARHHAEGDAESDGDD